MSKDSNNRQRTLLISLIVTGVVVIILSIPVYFVFRDLVCACNSSDCAISSGACYLYGGIGLSFVTFLGGLILIITSKKAVEYNSINGVIIRDSHVIRRNVLLDTLRRWLIAVFLLTIPTFLFFWLMPFVINLFFSTNRFNIYEFGIILFYFVGWVLLIVWSKRRRKQK